jgi:hypothetical protein
MNQEDEIKNIYDEKKHVEIIDALIKNQISPLVNLSRVHAVCIKKYYCGDKKEIFINLASEISRRMEQCELSMALMKNILWNQASMLKNAHLYIGKISMQEIGVQVSKACSLSDKTIYCAENFYWNAARIASIIDAKGENKIRLPWLMGKFKGCGVVRVRNNIIEHGIATGSTRHTREGGIIFDHPTCKDNGIYVNAAEWCGIFKRILDKGIANLTEAKNN